MSIRVRATIVFVAAAILLAALMTTIVAFESASARNQERSDKVTFAIIAGQNLLRHLVDAETGVRGYIASGQTLFLDPYRAALSEIPEAIDELGAAVESGVLPAASGREINQRALRVMYILQQEVLMMAARNRDAALLQTRQEKAEMDAFRAALGTQVDRWRSERVSSAASLSRVRKVLLGVSIAGSIAVIGGLLSSLWYFGFGLIRRIEILYQNALRIGRSEPLLPLVNGKDEIGRLDVELHNMSRTITERETAMSRFRLIFEAARDAIAFIDFDSGKILEANPAACTLYGYSHDEFIGLPSTLLRAPQQRAGLQQFLEQAFTAGASAEALAMRRDGTTFPVEVTIRGTTVEGRRLIVTVVRDATERENTRRQLLAALDDAVRASRLKSDFVAGISHEIRTPMNGIIGMTDLLLRTKMDDEQREYAETIRESGEALLRIIGDILDFSKIEAGKVEIESAAFDLRRVVESTAAIVGPNAARKGIGLMTFVDPRLPSLVRGDSGRLRQVLLNLAGNAIKFTGQGCVTISVEPDTNNTVRFSVVDSGIGMSPETLQRLFKPFSQGDASTTRRYGGTGLGLSISQRLVELMGGRLEVTSKETLGSRFWFTLPLPVVSEGDGVIALRGRRCAIVVADNTARSMLERYAKSWEMPVVASAHPDDIVFVGHFDVAIADAQGMSVSQRVSVGRLIAIVDDSTEADLRRGNSILRTPLTQSAVYEALDEALAASRVTQVEPEQVSPLGVRVLLAEDNAVNQRVARRQLERLGCSVVIASTGREALERIDEQIFDIVLMDCHMPEMDGYTAARHIHDRAAEAGPRVPIIALTAGAMEEDRIKCLAAGMDDFLSKPIDLEALRSAIVRWTAKGSLV